MSDINKVKTLTINGEKYRLASGTETLSCGSITCTVDESGNINVSNLFSSANTSYDAANINYTATGESTTTVKAKIQNIETQVGTAAASLTTALGTSAS